MTETSYIVATNKPWHASVFKQRLCALPGRWLLVQSPDELTLELVHAQQPRYIFFPHWSERVPQDILDVAECICFHETNLPYGRGGSPVQNLIVRGHKDTVICALRMVEELDAGPVYCRETLSLEGSAQDIFERSAHIIASMIGKIICEQPMPEAQQGEALVFKRRKPEQSKINTEINSIDDLYDHIRMLDAESYPRAFLETEKFRMEFSRATKTESGINAHVTISLKEVKID